MAPPINPVTSNAAMTTTPALLGTPTSSRELLVLTNPSASGITLLIGGSTVTATNYAFSLAAGDPPLVITNGPGDMLAAIGWYGRALSGSGTVYVTEDTEKFS